MIPITTVRLGEEEERLVLEVLRSGQLAQGEYVEHFEQAVRPSTACARGRRQQWHDGARRGASGPWHRPGRRGDHVAVHVRRDAERDP